jgi:hypothetical protein
MATQLIDLGNIRFIWKGDWDLNDTYELNDVVRYNNIVWVYINQIPSSDIQITNTNYWSRMVEGSEIPPTENQAGKVLKTDGTLTFWSDSFDTFSIGADITDFVTSAGLTDVALGIQGSSTSFVQTALVNTGSGSSSSADFIAYSSNGTNESGWIDMGITNQSFNDPTFSLTGAGDGYIFMSGAIAGVVTVSQYSVAGTQLNLISPAPHGMIAGVIFDLVLPVAPTLEGRYTVVSAPSTTQVVVATPGAYTGGNVPLTSVINSQMNKFTGDGNLVFATDSTGLSNNIVVASGGLQSGNEQMIFTPDDGIEIYDEIFFGTGAKSFNTNAGLTNAAAVFELNGSPYAQLAIHNNSANSSTDFIAYANNGDDTAGWIDMGITGSTFNQGAFNITGPNDGYIFYNAPTNTTGEGNLVLATGATGSYNRIIFGAGGYVSGAEQMVITPAKQGVRNGNIHIEIATASTSPTTGALTVVGGVGISGDVNIAGNLSFGGAGSQTGVQTLEVAFPIVFVADGNTGDAIDFGVVGEYVSSGTKYAGVLRDASDGIFKFFKGAVTKPTNTLDFAQVSLTYADVRLGALTSGAITAGAISATSLTTTGGITISGTSDIQEMREQVVNVTLASNVGTLDWTAGNIYYIATAPTANMTLNVTNMPTDNDKIMTVNVLVTQGATGYVPTTFQVAGTNQTLRWPNGAVPTPTSSAGKIDIFTFNLLRTGSSWIVFANSNLNY